MIKHSLLKWSEVMTGKKKEPFSKWISMEKKECERECKGESAKRESEWCKRNEKTDECCEIHLRANRVAFAFGNL